MLVGENESDRFWVTVLNGLKKPDVEDVFIACTNNLTGIDAGIMWHFHKPRFRAESSYNCAISGKYASYKDLKVPLVRSEISLCLHR